MRCLVAVTPSPVEKTHAAETSKMFIAMNRFKVRSLARGNEADFQSLRFYDHARDMAFDEVVLAARLAGKTALTPRRAAVPGSFRGVPGGTFSALKR